MSKYMSQNFKSIILKGNQSGVVNKEAVLDVTGAAGSEVNPGFLVEITADDPTSMDRDTCQPHSTAGSKVRAILIEDELQGKGIYADADSADYGKPPKDDLYAFSAGDRLQYRIAQSGDQYLCVAFEASAGTGQVFTKGADVYSAGDGTITTTAAGNNEAIGKVMETVTIPDGGEDDRCYVPVEFY